MFQIGLKKLSFGQKNKSFLQFIGSNHGMLAEREKVRNTDDLLSKASFFISQSVEHSHEANQPN
jgi:hypothetical protein